MTGEEGGLAEEGIENDDDDDDPTPTIKRFFKLRFILPGDILCIPRVPDDVVPPPKKDGVPADESLSICNNSELLVLVLLLSISSLLLPPPTLAKDLVALPIKFFNGLLPYPPLLLLGCRTGDGERFRNLLLPLLLPPPPLFDPLLLPVVLRFTGLGVLALAIAAGCNISNPPLLLPGGFTITLLFALLLLSSS